MSFNFPEDLLSKESRFPHHLRKFIPNAYARPPSRLSSFSQINHCMKGAVFITTCHVSDGDELLMDYRLNTTLKERIPAWYQSYDEEAMATRWGDDSASETEKKI